MKKGDKIKRVLVLNRGEIACRIIKTLKKLKLTSIVFFSDPDSMSKFVDLADETYPLNGINNSDTYLNIPKIISMIKEYKIDAVHPGYGFLSENDKFITQLEKENVQFIGPSASSVKSMGGKISSKMLANKANVTVVPGFIGEINSGDQAKKIISEIGLPVIMKASAGGGGKGMRIVNDLNNISECIEMTKAEALKNFGNDEIFIEKYVENPRHIEVQIIADKMGNVLCLGDRDCSIQRFHQKIIEESPAIFLKDETRKKMYEQSVSLAKEVKYHSAGTMEFIVDKDQNFYFLEMNTRLQVEHTVTEKTTGLDIVELMISVANGEELPLKQKDVQVKGHSIECRVCSEDVSKNFMPSIGRLSYYSEPEESSRIRIDSGVYEGYEITPYYDAMIAKVITFGNSRTEAIQEMKLALSLFDIEGVHTNILFLESIVRNNAFIQNNLTTSFIPEQYPNGFKTDHINDDTINKMIFASIVIFNKHNNALNSDNEKFLKNNFIIENRVNVEIEDKNYNIKFRNIDETSMSLTNEQDDVNKFHYSYQYGDRKIFITQNNEVSCIKIKKLQNGFILNFAGISKYCNVHSDHYSSYLDHMKNNKTIKKLSKHLTSPITGLLIKMFVKEGDIVQKDQQICIIEAMKMQNVISSERGGKIKNIVANINEQILKGKPIVEYESE